MREEYYPGMYVVIGGDTFTYNGEEYGQGTRVVLNDEYYKRTGEFGYTMNGERVIVFAGNDRVNGGWLCGEWYFPKKHRPINPEKDIKRIGLPVYRMTKKELVWNRIKSGTWWIWVWPHTLFYLFCLLISPLFQQWYLVWTTGLYLYLRLCYIELSKP